MGYPKGAVEINAKKHARPPQCRFDQVCAIANSLLSVYQICSSLTMALELGQSLDYWLHDESRDLVDCSIQRGYVGSMTFAGRAMVLQLPEPSLDEVLAVFAVAQVPYLTLLLNGPA